MKLIINNPELAALEGVPVGTEIEIACRKGVPTSREWRNRLKDAALDGCVSVQHNTPKQKPSKKDAE